MSGKVREKLIIIQTISTVHKPKSFLENEAVDIESRSFNKDVKSYLSITHVFVCFIGLTTLFSNEGVRLLLAS